MSASCLPRLACLALLFASAWAAAEAPAAAAGPDAAAIVAEYGLREDSRPMSSYPGWAPQRVVVAAPAGIAGMLPDFAERLQAVAADVELVIHTGDPFAMSAELLSGADGLIGLCTPETLARADGRLLWLHNYSVGMDLCAGLEEADFKDRVFTNSKRLSGPDIAEHAVAMVLALARNFPAFQRAQAERDWQRSLARGSRFGELRGKTLLVVGLGGIGTEVAWRAHGLGMRVIATRNSRREGPDFVEYVGLPDELHRLAGDADVVVNALPLTADTADLFDRAFFAAVKPGAIFVSVGRGKSTVTADLVAALESGRLYGAGLDVTEPEPLPADSPLWSMDNVIITPHVSATGADSARRIATIAIENLRRYVAGEPLLNLVDMRAGY
jgi:phosphoglycerate dehydrogenase-like enzyme